MSKYSLITEQSRTVSDGLSYRKNLLTALSNITSVPVTYREQNAAITWECNCDCKVCCSNREYYNHETFCGTATKNALEVCRNMDDVYLYLCESGLINMLAAYYDKGILKGYFILGPLAIGIDRDRVIDKFYQRLPEENIDPVVLLSAVSKMRVYAPKDIDYILSLFRNCVFSVPEAQESDAGYYSTRNEQKTLYMGIYEAKKKNEDISYPYEEEKEISAAVISGNVTKVMPLMAKYVNSIAVYEAGDVISIRLRMIVFFSMLHQMIRKTGDNSEKSVVDTREFLDAGSIQELAEVSFRYAENLAEKQRENRYTGESRIINEAIAYMEEHYMENISLKDISEELHISKNYLSALFKRETGKTITEHINGIKLNCAKDLLLGGNSSVTDIAMQIGYESESYFIKMYKRQYGMTPAKYRKNNSM